MAETFRPERRPIRNSEINQLNPEQTNQDMANNELPINKAFGGNVPTPPNISGNIPPIMKTMMQENMPQSTQGPQPRLTNSSSPANYGMVSGNNKQLEALISGIRNNNQNYHKIVLPSRGKFYNGEDGPSDGVLHIRNMTGEEEQILATPAFTKKGRAIDMIFERCLQEKYKTDHFLTIDRTYLLIFLRGISYSHTYDVEVKCPLCERKFATEIDLNTLYLNVCPDNFGLSDLEDVLPTTGYKFKYRLSTGADDQTVQAYRERRIKGFDTAGTPDDTLLYRTALMIQEIEGITEKTDIQKLLKVMPTGDLTYLRNVVNEPPFGVDTKVEITCSLCVQDFGMDLPLDASFFFPRLKKRGQVPA